MKKLTFYTKPNCGLCEEAAEVIASVRQRIAFEIEERNILDNLLDYERYKHDIPVIVLDAREIARHRVDAVELERAIGGR